MSKSCLKDLCKVSKVLVGRDSLHPDFGTNLVLILYQLHSQCQNFILSILVHEINDSLVFQTYGGGSGYAKVLG